MKLFEDEAKAIFASNGIEIPKNFRAGNVEEALNAYEKTSKKVAIKPLGIKGRGKEGAVFFSDTRENVSIVANSLFGKVIKGKTITEILIDEFIEIKKEIYISITMDFSIGLPVLVLSEEGGIAIEDIAKRYPEKIIKIPLSIKNGLNKETLKKEIAKINIDSGALLEIIEKLYKIFRKYDAETIEINPLALSTDGKFIALDAVFDINDDSLSRHPDFDKLNKERKYKSEYEKEMGELGWSYIDMDGTIGIISSGAGLSMATLDLIVQQGCKPANFLDMAQVDGEGIYKGLTILSRKKNVKIIFINLFAGLNRCDAMAEGVKKFALEHKEIPIITRMVGNREEDGAKILLEAGIKNMNSLEGAVEKIKQVEQNGYTTR